MTSSAEPGTETPPVPPDVADQLAVLFQLEEAADTQNLGAASARRVEQDRISRQRNALVGFMVKDWMYETFLPTIRVG